MRGGGGVGGGPSLHDDHEDISTMNTTIKTRDSVTFKREDATASDHTNSTDKHMEEKSTTLETSQLRMSLLNTDEPENMDRIVIA